jgi:hypothetical protein
MTRSYRPQPVQRITQPLVAYGRPPRDPAISSNRFTCFRLVPAGDASFVAIASPGFAGARSGAEGAAEWIELHHSSTRMFAFVPAATVALTRTACSRAV